MNDYKELIEVLKNAEHIALCGAGAFNTVLVERCYEAADAIEQLVKEYNELDKAHDEMFLELCKVKKERDALRNELCLRCGEYVEAHNGACDGCKWRVGQ